MKNEIITFTSPKSSTSEVFRNLRNNIQFINDDNKSMLITSVDQEEGKSFISANLAITYAKTGKKVILVDADMRKGKQHDLFEVSNEIGLSNYLTEEGQENKNDLEKYLKQTEIENLYILTAGKIAQNPSDLLSTSKMYNLIKKLEKKADVVIYDTTSIFAVTDALILAKQINYTILVATHKQTKIEDLKKAKRNIEKIGAKVCGIVINKIPKTQNEFENAYYYENEVTIIKKEKWYLKIYKKISNIIKEKIKIQKESKLQKNQDKKQSEKQEKNDIQEQKNNTKIKKQKNKKVKEQDEEDIDINVILKQLTKYLSEDKK